MGICVNPDSAMSLFLIRKLWRIMTESQGLFQRINEKKVFNVNGINILKWGVPKYFAWT